MPTTPFKPMIPPFLEIPLINQLTAIADDHLILAHRNAEWTGHAPILEEDIALANIAQDELGHAALLYELLADLNHTEPDQMAFFRDASQFRNTQLVELPKGDWAFTMLRQYLFDAFELAYLNLWQQTAYTPLAEIAGKMYKEELYHLRHTHIWVERLGLGTAESHQRMQKGLNELWKYAQQLFVPLPEEGKLVQVGFVPAQTTVYKSWQAIVVPHLQKCGLIIPEERLNVGRDQHTEHLPALLADMQQVARADPTADW